MGMVIDAQDFKVKMTPEAIGGKDGKRSFIGSTEEEKNLIVIDGTLVESRGEEVFLHELIHLAAMGKPEFMVTNLSTRLYGFLKGNDLLRPGLIAKVSDGILSKAEMSKLNEESNKMAERVEEMGGMMPSNYAVSEGPWEGEPGQLRELDGRLNRTAVHKAVRDLIVGRLPLNGTTRRAEASRLLRLYKDVLQEPVPPVLTNLAR